MTRYFSQYDMDDFNYFLGIAGITGDEYDAYYGAPGSNGNQKGFYILTVDNQKVAVDEDTFFDFGLGVTKRFTGLDGKTYIGKRRYG